MDESADDPVSGPLRHPIRFAPGAISAVVENTVQGDEAHPYRLRAMAGQIMLLHIDLLAQGPETWVQVETGGATIPPLAGEGSSLWRTWLGPPAGDRGVHPHGPQSAGPPSDYRLTVVIKTPAPEAVQLRQRRHSGQRRPGTLDGVDVRHLQPARPGGPADTPRAQPLSTRVVAAMGADGLIFDRFLYPTRASPWTGQLPRTQDYLSDRRQSGGDMRDYTLDVTITTPFPADLLDACPGRRPRNSVTPRQRRRWLLLSLSQPASPSFQRRTTTELRGPFRARQPGAPRSPDPGPKSRAGSGQVGRSNCQRDNCGNWRSSWRATLTLGGEPAILLVDVPGRLPSRRAIVVHDDVGYQILVPSLTISAGR